MQPRIEKTRDEQRILRREKVFHGINAPYKGHKRWENVFENISPVVFAVFMSLLLIYRGGNVLKRYSCQIFCGRYGGRYDRDMVEIRRRCG